MILSHSARQTYIYNVHLLHHETENEAPVIFFHLHNFLLTF